MLTRDPLISLRSAVILPLLFSAGALAHGTASNPDESNGRCIDFPDTERYQTLVVDLHTHSVFSDGHVWPRIRIGEALRDGLDAIAITEHLEWQPHLADIPHPDRNRSFLEAVSAAEDREILVIPGSEITREAPAGHMNAVFIEDANKLMQFGTPADPADTVANYTAANEWPAQQAVESANAQSAFVFWNHPWWLRQNPDGIAVMPEFHISNARKGLLHGIEVANGSAYSEEALQIALDHDLTMIGTSDVHNLIDWDYQPHKGGHRPVTLVFAKTNTAEAIKEALFDRRTVVWLNNQLIGRKKTLMPLLEASLTLDSAEYAGETELVKITLSNQSDADFQLRNTTDYTLMGGPDLVEIPAHETVDLYLKKKNKKSRTIKLEFEVLNALMAPEKHPVIRFTAKVKKGG